MHYTQEQVNEFLKRIAFEGEVKQDKETLDKIIRGYQLNIPFESLDMFDFHLFNHFEPQHLYDKIVMHKRGGYCFESNAFFCYMLQSMGFDARPCLVRVMFAFSLERMAEAPIDHRATLVTIDGQIYFCEVAIGAAMPPKSVPVPVETGETPWIEMGADIYKIREVEPGWYATFRRIDPTNDIFDDSTEPAEKIQVCFSLATAHDADFVPLNYYVQKSGTFFFSEFRVANIRTENGYRSLIANLYREVADGVRTEREIPNEELRAILKEKFNIDPEYQFDFEK